MINSDFVKKRVVIYARVSTEHEAQMSALENQVDWYKPILAARPEWTLVGQYIDEGITGTSAEKRPQFMKMIRDAKQKTFDMIITREVSRFARNTVDTLQYTRELKSRGVEVFFINDNIKTFDGDGELRLTIMATLAQDESRKTSVRVKSGQQTSMNNGVLYGNGNILGYNRVGKEMIVDPEQAKTVKMIFELYLEGNGLVRIKDELERRGRKTSAGKDKWYPTVISHVLKNSFYCGIITYHKEYTPDYLTQKKIKNYGEIEKTTVQGNHDAIVTVEEFERVQTIMESKRSSCKNLNTGRSTGKRPRTTVWGKLLICECGHKFSMRVWDRKDRIANAAYQCYNSVHTGSYESRKKRGLPLDDICQTPMIPEWRLQMMANYIFRKYLSEKDKVLMLANSMLEAHIADTEDMDDYGTLIEEKTSELSRLNKKLDNFIEMRSEGEISKEMFKTKATELEPKILKLQSEIAELETKQIEVPEIVDYQEKLTVLQYALEQYTNADENDVPESVIEAFVEKIVASKDGFDWYLRFDGNPTNPLHCTTKGKRKSTTSISVAGELSPAIHKPSTGCYT
ncbi:MAG: recombinase family protein [Eubacteriales bacterium]|nr:recombinase family protein [Eubacteriales bacterium]